MSQYALTLNLPPLFTKANFMVSGCNREAWQWIEAWPNWTGSHALFLSGLAGSGKSHLGAIWASRAHASILSASALADREPDSGNWLIEDVEKEAQERFLLHWFNATRENGGSLLLTSAIAAAQLPFTLPDLTSRLLATPCVHIKQPDDEALEASMRKQFIDRQMKVGDEIIAYILPRMERSFARIQETVERLDHTTLAEHKNITIPFVKRVLGA